MRAARTTAKIDCLVILLGLDAILKPPRALPPKMRERSGVMIKDLAIPGEFPLQLHHVVHALAK